MTEEIKPINGAEAQAVNTIDQVMSMLSQWHVQQVSEVGRMSNIPLEVDPDAEYALEIKVPYRYKNEQGEWTEGEYQLESVHDRQLFVAGLVVALSYFENLPFYSVEEPLNETQQPSEDSGS